MSVAQHDIFGRWQTLEDHLKSTGKVLCRCVCGTERLVEVRNLKSGASQSCGCIKREQPGNYKHGCGYDDYRYLAWKTIKGKCLRKTHKDWRYYGGRGIGMYTAWINDFPAFA